MSASTSRRRDLIAIGGSAGAIPALITLLGAFEPQADATVFLVVHRSNESQHLKSIIERVSKLEVCEPDDCEPMRPNCLYIARPDRHMMIGENHIHLRHGPKENNFRPAIDPLFRSLAVFGSTRSVGVVLSGYLDDGAAGARAIVGNGGQVLVHDPADAMSPDMPRAAISAVGEPTAILDPQALGERLSEMVTEEVGPHRKVDGHVKLEMMIAGLEKASMASEEKLGELSPYNCPDCNGVLWEIEDGPLTRYRCHTGHAYTSRALEQRQDEMLERSLFDSLRACRERVNFVKNLAEKDGDRREVWAKKLEVYERDCALLEALLKDRSPLPSAR